MDYQFYAISSAIFFSFTIILVKYISKHIIKDFYSFLFWTYITVLPFAFLIILYKGFFFDTRIILPMILNALLLVIGQYFFSKGVYLVDASVISPLFQIQSAFVVILASIFLSEKYNPVIYLYILSLIFGAILVSTNDKTKIKGIFQKGAIFIILMQILHAGANIAVGFALKLTNSWYTLFYSFLFSSIIVSLFIVLKKIKIEREPKKILWMVLRAFFLFISTGLLYKAFETNISLSSALGLLSSPIVFVISIVSSIVNPDLLEKQSRKTYFIRTIGLITILYSAIHINLLR